MTKHAGMRESGYIEHDRAPARSARWSKAESSGTAQEMKQSAIELAVLVRAKAEKKVVQDCL